MKEHEHIRVLDCRLLRVDDLIRIGLSEEVLIRVAWWCKDDECGLVALVFDHCSSIPNPNPLENYKNSRTIYVANKPDIQDMDFEE